MLHVISGGCANEPTQHTMLGAPQWLFDHLIPESVGGDTSRENLWLACRRCNEFKGSQTEAIDPFSGNTASLFNPRTQSWSVHFTWGNNGTKIVGLTAVGRATVIALRLNNEEIVGARSLWVQAGWHPPKQ